jgi:hypothetical protein
VPSSVAVRRLPLRLNSANCAIFSSWPINRLTCGCEVCVRRAASVIEPDTITARKASMCRSDMRVVAISDMNG